MSTGRGAWTTRGKRNRTGNYARLQNKPRDGVIPEQMPPDPLGYEDISDDSWFTSVNFGVFAIQSLLVSQGFDVEETGIYRRETERAVEQLQARTTGLSVSGMVGQPTSQVLLRPVAISAAQAQAIHPRWIWGLAHMESGFDPGAQGWTTPNDFGWLQFNTMDGVPTPAQAFDPVWAGFEAARRFRKTRDEFSAKGHTLAIDCAIMQHRSPAAAEYLYTHEQPIGPDSDAYVQAVRSFAEEW